MRRRTEVVTTTWRQLWRRTSAAIADPVQTRWLLEEASGLGGAALLRDLDREADPESAARLESLMQRRLAGEPLQHVLGHWGFRTLDVAVDSRVLVPRPETELVVEVALSELDRLCGLRPAGGLLAVDLGTGSGVIALSLVAERPEVRVVATVGRNLVITRRPVQGEGLGEASARVKAEDATVKLDRCVLERGEKSSADTAPANVRLDPHAFYLRGVLVQLAHRSATDCTTIEAGYEERSPRRDELDHRRRRRTVRVETSRETGAQLRVVTAEQHRGQVTFR